MYLFLTYDSTNYGKKLITQWQLTNNNQYNEDEEEIESWNQIGDKLTT